MRRARLSMAHAAMAAYENEANASDSLYTAWRCASASSILLASRRRTAAWMIL